MKSVQELIAELPQYERKVDKRQVDSSGKELISYQCYCCYDKGEITPHLARLIMPDYQIGDIVACSRTSDCRKVWVSMADGVIDNIHQSTCEALHQINLSQWKSFTEAQAEKHKAMIDAFASSM